MASDIGVREDYLMTKRIIAALLLTSSCVSADIYVGAESIHLGGGDYSNSSHNLFAAEYHGATAGYFKNSYSQDTYFTGYSFDLYENELIDVGIIAGGMVGYDREDVPLSIGDVAPFVSPRISFKGITPQPTILMLGRAVAITARFEF